jgi:hypothetical protein
MASDRGAARPTAQGAAARLARPVGPRYDHESGREAGRWATSSLSPATGPPSATTADKITFATIETVTFATPDPDPTDPAEHDFTTTAATLSSGWYRVVFKDAAAHQEATAAVFVGDPAGNLTTVGDVRQFLQKEGRESHQDAIIEALITRASQEMIAYTRREYAPAVSALLRQFRYEGQGHVGFKRYDLRAATLIQTREIASGSAQTTLVADDDYELDPLEAPDGVYTGMYLATSRVPLIVSVTGDWGWPAVPARVQHWCNVTVKEWLRKDVSAFSTGFDMNEDRIDRPESLPSAVRRALNVDRRRRALIA